MIGTRSRFPLIRNFKFDFDIAIADGIAQFHGLAQRLFDDRWSINGLESYGWLANIHSREILVRWFDRLTRHNVLQQTRPPVFPKKGLYRRMLKCVVIEPPK